MSIFSKVNKGLRPWFHFDRNDDCPSLNSIKSGKIAWNALAGIVDYIAFLPLLMQGKKNLSIKFFYFFGQNVVTRSPENNNVPTYHIEAKRRNNECDTLRNKKLKC